MVYPLTGKVSCPYHVSGTRTVASLQWLLRGDPMRLGGGHALSSSSARGAETLPRHVARCAPEPEAWLQLLEARNAAAELEEGSDAFVVYALLATHDEPDNAYWDPRRQEMFDTWAVEEGRAPAPKPSAVHQHVREGDPARKWCIRPCVFTNVDQSARCALLAGPSAGGA